METKICNRRNHKGPKELPITEFYRDGHAYDGWMAMCKACSREKSIKWRSQKAKDPKWRKRFNEQNTKYRKAGGKVLQMYQAAQERARKFNLEFSITKEDIVIPEVCPVLGIKIKAGEGRKWDPQSKGCHLNGARDSSPSLDRIDNSKGYTKENIRVTSWRANYLKHTATLDELILLGEDAKQLKQRSI